MRELGVQAEHANQQQDEKRVGLDDACEKALSRGHRQSGDLRTRQRELGRPPAKTRDRAAVQFSEQRLAGVGDQIAQSAIHGFPFGERLRISDGGFGQRDVAAAALGIAAQVGGGVVELLFERVVNGHQVTADAQQRGRGAGVCRRHGRNVR